MIGLYFDNRKQRADLGYTGKTLMLDYSFQTFCTIVLGTDRRAQDGDRLPAGETWRRGWWWDTYAESEDEIIGTRLWTLRGAKIDADLLIKARAFVLEGLDVAVRKGAYARIEVTVTRRTDSSIAILIEPYKPDQTVPVWSETWEYQL
jgi:phage gp46-like protein